MNRKRLIIYFIILIIAIPLLFLVVSQFSKTGVQGLPFIPIPTPFQNISPSPSEEANGQRKFSVLATQPANGQQNVSSGEIEISIQTNVNIISPSSFSFTLLPALGKPAFYQVTNTYPTKKITVQIYGGLQTSTTYTSIIKNSNNQIVYSWSFTTSNKPAADSSLLQQKLDQQVNNEYYPLSPYLPYSTNDFSLGYADHLTLNVWIKNPDVEKVKQEVNDWIKSKGIDPSTHKYIYINKF